jgi:guanine nucleotide-binding protein subunit alpha
MKLIHSSGYTKEERQSFREIIFSNTVQSMTVVLEAMDTMAISVLPENQSFKDIILELPEQIEGDKLPPKVGESIKKLYADPGVQACISRSREYQLNDSAT